MEIDALTARIEVKEHLIMQQDSIIKLGGEKINALTKNADAYLETIDNKDKEIKVWQKRADGKRLWIGSTIVASIIALAAIL